MESLFWTDSECLHTCRLNGFDACIRILNTQTIDRMNVHKPGCINEQVGSGFAVYDTVAIGDAIKITRNIQPVEHYLGVFAARSTCDLDPRIPNLLQQLSSSRHQLIWGHALD